MTYRLRLFNALLGLLLAAGCGERAGDPPPILFLRAADGGPAQLYIQSFGGEARRLTGGDDPAAPEVIAYAPAPDGERIAYAVDDGTSGTALRLVGADGRGDALLLDCPAAECAEPVWSPDGRRLVYERRPRVDDGTLGSPRLHWLDPTTGETLPLIAGDETPGYGARFSPDGTWLSYVSPADDGIVLYRPADGAQRLLVSRVGSPAAWSPDGAAVVYSDIVVQAHETAPGDGGPAQESASVYLYRTDLTEPGSRERLSPEAAVADGAAAFSPDGKWIAFLRAAAGTGAGRQLWLMRADGSEARALSADPAITHGPPSWSPDGRYLLFQRYEAATGETAVWILEVGTTETKMVAGKGFLPGWLTTNGR